MNLMKIFEFKGLFQAGNKMATPSGYFRRFTNAFKDKTKRIVPYGAGPTTANKLSALQYPGINTTTFGTQPLMSAIYRGGIFQLLGQGNKAAIKFFDASGELIVNQAFRRVTECGAIDITDSMLRYPAGNYTHAVVNGKLFINEYVETNEFVSGSTFSVPTVKNSALFKFDGLRIVRAGLPTPILQNNSGDGIGAPATPRRLISIYVTIGLDGEPVFSDRLDGKIESVVQELSPTIFKYHNSSYPISNVRRTDVEMVLNTATYPKERQPDDNLYEFERPGVTGGISNYYDTKFIRIDSSSELFTMADGGMRIQHPINKAPKNVYPGDWLLAMSGTRGKKYHAFYMQFLSVDPATRYMVFSGKLKAFNSYTVSWEDLEGGSPDAVSAAFRGLSNIYVIVGYAPTLTGNPYIIDICPYFHDENTTTEYQVGPEIPVAGLTSRPFLGVVSSYIADWYDLVTSRTTFPPMKGITNYTGLLVGFDDNALYFSDTSIGGSTEMASGISNLVPTGSEYGKIVAICASEEYMLISRERRNYILVGELTTGNVNIIECDQPLAGAANARSVANIFSENILMMNSTGIYLFNSSGKTTDISASIKDLFMGDSVDGNLFQKSAFTSPALKKIQGNDGGVFKIALEESRGYVLILTGRRTVNAVSGVVTIQSNILVFDTNDGSWYEWSGNCASIEALNGVVYQLGSDLKIEDSLLRIDKQLLVTSWDAMGEPSLEKQFTQVRMYGKFYPSIVNAGVKVIAVRQQNDWNSLDVSPIYETDTTYDPDRESVGGYAHKKRLDSSKALVTSIILDSDKSGGFTLEGLEIEGKIIQEGMKK